MTLFHELTLDDVTIVDDPDKTPARGIALCGCGKRQERGGPMSLAGVSVNDWPCSSGTLNGRKGRWQYCATTGRIIADTR